MARLISREFDATQPTYARRAFTANGHRFAAGGAFDWRLMSISQRKAKMLFDSGHIGHQAPAVVTPVPAPTEPAPLTLTKTDELDLLEDMKELRAIAYAEGAAIKVSKADQRQAIRDNRG